MSGFAFPAGRTLDLLCLGRAGVDMYAEQADTPLEHVRSFRKSVGGSPANIATALARLGGRAGVISAVSDDGFGRYVRQFLQDNGVDVQGITTAPAGARNSTAFTEMRPDDCQVIIYRNGAADLCLAPTDIAPSLVGSSRALLVTGTALSASPSREATLHAMDLARRAGTVVVLDLDYRPYGWLNAAQASVHLRVASAMADMVIGNREEFDVLEHLQPAAQRDDQHSARQVLQGVTQAAVVKDGARGCRAFLRDGTALSQGVFAVAARKPFGAGDAFAATLLWQLLQGHGWPAALHWGAAAAALNVSRDGCAEAMANQQELRTFMASYPQPLQETAP
nr:5-dehydro-2-deoxygluconokinase [uncultured Albidiferax sp.]